MELWTEYIRFTVALIAVLDPFAAVPIFLALTSNQSTAERARTAAVTTVAVATVLLVAALTGERLLALMGASMASFRVGGGIVLLLMAVEMLRAQTSAVRQTPEEAVEAGQKSAVAIVPLGIPLLAGPGAISTVIIEMDRGQGWAHPFYVVGVILLVCALLWLALRLALPIGNRMGPLGIRIANRLLGLLLAAIAVEIMANGLRALFPALGG